MFQDITNWKKGTEHTNGLELSFKGRDHLSEKWETLNPDGPAYAEASARQTRKRISNRTNPVRGGRALTQVLSDYENIRSNCCNRASERECATTKFQR